MIDRMDIIGQNGNDGLHYESLEPDYDSYATAMEEGTDHSELRQQREDYYADMAEGKSFERQMYEKQWKHDEPMGSVETFYTMTELVAELEKLEQEDECSHNVDWGSLDEKIMDDKARVESCPTDPSHYNQVPAHLQHWDVVGQMGWDYYIGAATKYIWRAGKKRSAGMSDNEKEVEDLKKAVVYLNKKIDLLGE